MSFFQVSREAGVTVSSIGARALPPAYQTDTGKKPRVLSGAAAEPGAAAPRKSGSAARRMASARREGPVCLMVVTSRSRTSIAPGAGPEGLADDLQQLRDAGAEIPAQLPDDDPGRGLVLDVLALQADRARVVIGDDQAPVGPAHVRDLGRAVPDPGPGRARQGRDLGVVPA